MKAGASKASKTKDSCAKQLDPPGHYRCPICGERLSGPDRYYECPKGRKYPNGEVRR